MNEADILDLQSQFQKIRNPTIQTVHEDFKNALKHLTKFKAMWLAVQEPIEHDRYPKLWDEFGDCLASLLSVEFSLACLVCHEGDYDALRRHYRWAPSRIWCKFS